MGGGPSGLEGVSGPAPRPLQVVLVAGAGALGASLRKSGVRLRGGDPERPGGCPAPVPFPLPPGRQAPHTSLSEGLQGHPSASPPPQGSTSPWPAPPSAVPLVWAGTCPPTFSSSACSLRGRGTGERRKQRSSVAGTGRKPLTHRRRPEDAREAGAGESPLAPEPAVVGGTLGAVLGARRPTRSSQLLPSPQASLPLSPVVHCRGALDPRRRAQQPCHLFQLGPRQSLCGRPGVMGGARNSGRPGPAPSLPAQRWSLTFSEQLLLAAPQGTDLPGQALLQHLRGKRGALSVSLSSWPPPPARLSESPYLN